jgi:hypothetical protein
MDHMQSQFHPGTESDDEVTQEEFGAWWAHLPDFIKPGYPLDIPPERLPFAREVFTHMGAARLCPEAACRRAGACRGGDGPPCFRASRKDLSQVLFLWWMMLFFDFPWEEFAAALARTGNRYAPEPAKPPRARRRKRRRSPAPASGGRHIA